MNPHAKRPQAGKAKPTGGKTSAGDAKAWALALPLSLLVAGISRWALLTGQSYAGRYFIAISITMFVNLLLAVVLAVWQERAMVAPPFVVLAATLAAALFYGSELSSNLVLAELIIGAVALTGWLLALIGVNLRRRLRAMD